jgi:hypothetical protein
LVLGKEGTSTTHGPEQVVYEIPETKVIVEKFLVEKMEYCKFKADWKNGPSADEMEGYYRELGPIRSGIEM